MFLQPARTNAFELPVLCKLGTAPRRARSTLESCATWAHAERFVHCAARLRGFARHVVDVPRAVGRCCTTPALTMRSAVGPTTGERTDTTRRVRPSGFDRGDHLVAEPCPLTPDEDARRAHDRGEQLCLAKLASEVSANFAVADRTHRARVGEAPGRASHALRPSSRSRGTRARGARCGGRARRARGGRRRSAPRVALHESRARRERRSGACRSTSNTSSARLTRKRSFGASRRAASPSTRARSVRARRRGLHGVGDRRMARADLGIGGRRRRESEHQRAHPQEGPAADDGHAAPRSDVGNGRVGEGREALRIERLERFDAIDEMMWRAAPLDRRWLARRLCRSLYKSARCRRR